MSGEKTLGRFFDVRPIGRGGMGEVYAGVDPATGREVAIKLLASEAGDRSDVERFLEEGRLTAQPCRTHSAGRRCSTRVRWRRRPAR